MPKHFYQIIGGLMACNGEVTKPGDIVEWEPERADAWYPGKGWIKQIENPNPVKKPERVEPTKESEPISEEKSLEPTNTEEVDQEYAKEKPEPEKTESETETEPEKVKGRSPKTKRR